MHGLDAALLPRVAQHRQLPAAGGAKGDAAFASAPDDTAYDKQPRVEQRRGVRILRVFEERRVDRTGRVVQSEEDDTPAGPDRRCLRGDLDAGDEDLGLA